MYCVEVAAELLADVEEQTVRSVHQAQWPGRESPVKDPKRGQNGDFCGNMLRYCL